MVTNPGTPPRPGAIRALNHPAPVQAKTDPRGRPAVVLINRRWLPVVHVLDVWRIDDEWWRPEPVSRMYYQLDLTGLGQVILYQDLAADLWFRHRS